MAETLKIAAGTAKEAGAMPYLFGFGIIAAIVAAALIISKKFREGVSVATQGAGDVLKAGGKVASLAAGGAETLVNEGGNLAEKVGNVILRDPAAGYTVFMYPATHEHILGIYNRTAIQGNRLEGDRIAVLNYLRNSETNSKLSRPSDMELPDTYNGELIMGTGLTHTDYSFILACKAFFNL